MPPGPVLRLTKAHVERVHRDVPDPGPVHYPHLDDDDYAALTASLVAEIGRDPLCVFAYGSLIWKPAVEFGPGTHATLFGWHRSFCLRLIRFRGTPEQPGLMMALDRGGSCRGLAFPVIGDPGVEIDRLLRREMTTKPPTNMPRVVKVATQAGPLRAIAFTASRAGRFYQPQPPMPETARILARACGHWGSGADYLLNTIEHLAPRGIRDRNLWHLQALVAQQIEAETQAAEGPGRTQTSHAWVPVERRP
jgi:glutathione-specific gamma-glutamylcyclotransferase